MEKLRIVRMVIAPAYRSTFSMKGYVVSIQLHVLLYF